MTENETPQGETRSRQMSFHVLDNGSIRADFADGTASVELAISDVPEAVKLAAITEGLISRARGYTSRLTAEDRIGEKLAAAVKSAFDNLRAGIWKLEREGGGAVSFSIEVEAAYLFRKMKAEGKGETFSDTLESVQTLWDGLTDEQKAQVKALPRYKAAYAQVKSERSAARAAQLLKKAEAEEAEAPM